MLVFKTCIIVPGEKLAVLAAGGVANAFIRCNYSIALRNEIKQEEVGNEVIGLDVGLLEDVFLNYLSLEKFTSNRRRLYVKDCIARIAVTNIEEIMCGAVQLFVKC